MSSRFSYSFIHWWEVDPSSRHQTPLNNKPLSPEEGSCLLPGEPEKQQGRGQRGLLTGTPGSGSSYFTWQLSRGRRRG